MVRAPAAARGRAAAAAAAAADAAHGARRLLALLVGLASLPHAPGHDRLAPLHACAPAALRPRPCMHRGATHDAQQGTVSMSLLLKVSVTISTRRGQ
jgi:hypothetical protein